MLELCVYLFVFFFLFIQQWKVEKDIWQSREIRVKLFYELG